MKTLLTILSLCLASLPAFAAPKLFTDADYADLVKDDALVFNLSAGTQTAIQNLYVRHFRVTAGGPQSHAAAYQRLPDSALADV